MTWQLVASADAVTDEILTAATSIVDGWELSDGHRLDLGNAVGTAAMRKIQAHINQQRNGGL